MNERIRELIEQAYEHQPLMVVNPKTYQVEHKIGHGEAPMYHRVFNQEKFALLIVGECEAILKKDMELAHIQLIPLDFKMYANGRLQRTIKEHFGIE
jgi:hypothetical protein